MANEAETFDFDALDDNTRKRLTLLNSKIEQHKKRDAEGAFELGEYFDEVAEVVGNDKVCETWLESQFGYSGRHTRNYRSLRLLKPFKGRCISAAILPTALFQMAHADGDAIEAVLAEFEAGRKLRVEDVTRIIKGDSVEPKDASNRPVEDIPGLKGFEKYALHISKDRSGRLKDLLTHILTEVVSAYEPKLRGRALVKKDLREAVRLQAEEAYETLKASLGSFKRDGYWQNAIGHLNLEAPKNDGGWSTLLPTLHSLRYFEDVPATDAPEFLKATVIPQLQWALELSDDQVQALFAQASEKNDPKSAKSKRSAKLKKARTHSKATPETKTPLADNASEQPLSRPVFKLPDFVKQAQERSRSSQATNEDAA